MPPLKIRTIRKIAYKGAVAYLTGQKFEVMPYIAYYE
jgi:hypothetical protein